MAFKSREVRRAATRVMARFSVGGGTRRSPRSPKDFCSSSLRVVSSLGGSTDGKIRRELDCDNCPLVSDCHDDVCRRN